MNNLTTVIGIVLFFAVAMFSPMLAMIIAVGIAWDVWMRA